MITNRVHHSFTTTTTVLKQAGSIRSIVGKWNIWVMRCGSFTSGNTQTPQLLIPHSRKHLIVSTDRLYYGTLLAAAWDSRPLADEPGRVTWRGGALIAAFRRLAIHGLRRSVMLCRLSRRPTTPRVGELQWLAVRYQHSHPTGRRYEAHLVLPCCYLNPVMTTNAPVLFSRRNVVSSVAKDL